MKYILMFIVFLACVFAGNRPPVTITPRDGPITSNPSPYDTAGIRASLIAPCGDIRAILGPQGKNIAVCRHGDAIAVIYGARTGDTNNPMTIRITYSCNQGVTWPYYGPFTPDLRRIFGGTDCTPIFCTDPGACLFCYMKATSGYAAFPEEVIIEENLPSAPCPSAPINVTGSDSIYPWQTGICLAPDNPLYVVTHAFSYLSMGDCHLYCWYTPDGGYSWYGPIDMAGPINPAYGGNCGPKLRMGTGGYVAGIYNNAVGGVTNDGWPHFIESTDGGQTWLTPITLPVPHFDSAAGQFWWHEIEAEVVNDEPWLIANDIGGGGFWLYKGNGSPGNWTWTTWDLDVIGACSLQVADTLYQIIPGQFGSLCYDPVSGMILATYKGLARIIVGGNVYADGPAVCGVFTQNNGATWRIARPMSVWNTMPYSDWNATETAHRIANIDGHCYAYSIWIHNTNFNLYFEGGTTNNGHIIGAIQELADPRRYDSSLRIAPAICPRQCRMQFELPAGGPVSLKLYDLSGRLVNDLLDQRMAAGRHELTFMTGGYPAGVYFVTLESNGSRQTAKVIIGH